VESCPSCGSALPGVVRFCPQCGVPLAEPSPAIERKLVTILFADVSGYTTQAQRLQPQRINDLNDANIEAIIL
jgi:adenylate cyclase